MANLLRMRVVWGGSTVVGGGLSTFYFTEGATGQSSDVEDFFYALRAQFPIGTTISIPSNGDVINDSTGTLVGVWGSSGSAVVSGEGAAAHASGVGARIVWNTAGLNNGRRIKGSTFMVPVISGLYAADGTINDASITNMTAAATALITAQVSAFTIYSRSVDGGAGANNEVTSATVPDKITWLRTRRT